MRVLFTCGGTGGHIYPAIALANALQKLEGPSDILFIGAERSLEREIIPEAGFALETIRVMGLSRRNPWAAARSLAQALLATGRAGRIIKFFKPQVVVGTGGYASGPAIMAAVLARIPTLIHEQNAFPGLTTRLLAPFVDAVAVSQGESGPLLPKAKKLIVTGLPIRSSFYKTDRAVARRQLGLAADSLVVLAVGGSGGAQKLNDMVAAIAPPLLEDKKIVLLQVTGERYYNDISEKAHNAGSPLQWRVIGFAYDMPMFLAAADVIISRAGASTLEEITAVGVPAILIPSPNVTDNHQQHNALAMIKAGVATMITEDEISEDILLEQVNNLLEDEPLRMRMAEAGKAASHPQALHKLVTEIRALALG